MAHTGTRKRVKNPQIIYSRSHCRVKSSTAVVVSAAENISVKGSADLLCILNKIKIRGVLYMRQKRGALLAKMHRRMEVRLCTNHTLKFHSVG